MDNNVVLMGHARTASWALTYFLNQKHVDGMQKYFLELAKMPRDYELDEDQLLWVFCKSFGLLDNTNKPDEKKLNKIAEEWNTFIDQERLEMEDFIASLRKFMAQRTYEIKAMEEPIADGSAVRWTCSCFSRWSCSSLFIVCVAPACSSEPGPTFV